MEDTRKYSGLAAIAKRMESKEEAGADVTYTGRDISFWGALGLESGAVGQDEEGECAITPLSNGVLLSLLPCYTAGDCFTAMLSFYF